jgi:hypothetical protein
VAALLVLFIADGSRQPTSGPGWRILAYQRGVAGKQDVVVIPTQEALDAAWDRMLIRSSPPPLPTQAVTFWITATGALGCPAHFSALQVDRTTPAVAAIFTLALTARCDAIRVPDSFLVAVDRDRLPAGAFRFERVGPAGQPDGAVEIVP